MKYKIINKSTIHFFFDENGARQFITFLRTLGEAGTVSIIFTESENYRGKSLKALKFIVSDEGELVSFVENTLLFEIEEEMRMEFIQFIETAIQENGFRTPEMISFAPKYKKEVGICLYGFYKNIS